MACTNFEKKDIALWSFLRNPSPGGVGLKGRVIRRLGGGAPECPDNPADSGSESTGADRGPAGCRRPDPSVQSGFVSVPVHHADHPDENLYVEGDS
jgi:hypothetical protein